MSFVFYLLNKKKVRNLYDNKKCDLLKNLCQIRKWRCQAMCDDDLIVDF